MQSRNTMIADKAKVSRRGFIGGLAAATAYSAVAMADETKPLFKVGLVTDTHVRERRKSCERVELAYRLFKEKGVDMIVNCGDIADRFYPKGYKHYSDVRRETYPDAATAPKELYVFAYHDIIDYPGKLTNNLTPFPKVKELLGIPNEAYDEVVFKGFTFLVFPQWLDYRRYEATIARACAANPGKPVFIFDHVPPIDTTENSRAWGSHERRKILSKYPQVINISGHAHGSLRNEQNIWQGEFTDVSVACLAQWRSDFTGRQLQVFQNWSCLVMEVFPSKAVFRRFELQQGVEIGADAPWTVTWPYDPATARYNPERLRASKPKPQFPAGAKIALAPEGSPFTALGVTFPVAEDADTTYKYRLELARRDGAIWRTFASREICGTYHLPAASRETSISDTLSAGYFTPGEPCRITVTPVNFWGGEGKPIHAQWIPPEAKSVTRVWEGVPAPARAGEAFSFNGNASFSFPVGVWDKVPAGAKMRLTADLMLEQGDTRGVNFMLQTQTGKKRPFGTIYTPKGMTDFRYVVEFTRKAVTTPYNFIFRQGDPSKVLFRTLALDRLA